MQISSDIFNWPFRCCKLSMYVTIQYTFSIVKNIYVLNYQYCNKNKLHVFERRTVHSKNENIDYVTFEYFRWLENHVSKLSSLNPAHERIIFIFIYPFRRSKRQILAQPSRNVKTLKKNVVFNMRKIKFQLHELDVFQNESVINWLQNNENIIFFSVYKKKMIRSQFRVTRTMNFIPNYDPAHKKSGYSN